MRAPIFRAVAHLRSVSTRTVWRMISNSAPVQNRNDQQRGDEELRAQAEVGHLSSIVWRMVRVRTCRLPRHSRE